MFINRTRIEVWVLVMCIIIAQQLPLVLCLLLQSLLQTVPARFTPRVHMSWAPELAAFTRTAEGHIICWKFRIATKRTSAWLQTFFMHFWIEKNVTSRPRTQIYVLDWVKAFSSCDAFMACHQINNQHRVQTLSYPRNPWVCAWYVLDVFNNFMCTQLEYKMHYQLIFCTNPLLMGSVMRKQARGSYVFI